MIEGFGEYPPITLSERAYVFAHERHQGQTYDDGRAYIVHPIQVAALLRMVAPSDEALIAAGYLHDVIEDCGVTYAELVILFGKDVADLVNEVTHEGKPDEHGYYFPRLETRRGIMLKFADRLSNLTNMTCWETRRQEQYLRRSVFWRTT